MNKKVSVIVLCAALMASGLTGCGSGENALSGGTSAGTEGGGVASSEISLENTGEYQLPLVDEPTTITWATVENWYPNASYNDGLEIHKLIAEKTGITIEWQVLPDAQYLTSMQTRLAAASDLPDIVRVPNGDPTAYGQQGVLISMNEYIEKYGYGVKECFAHYPEAAKLMRSGDGHYYGLAPIVSESSHWMPRYMTIREDWLNNVGLSAPTTTDEWLNVLRAFRDNDANGNGDPGDEIPYGAEPEAFGGAFGLHLIYSSNGFFADENGQVYYQFADPRMKDFLTFANQMYSEGLLNPDYGNPDAELLSAKITRNIVDSSYEHPDLAMSYSTMLQDSVAPEAQFIPVVPPKGPNGDQTIEGYGTIDIGFQSITKDCKNPEAAFRLMDYFWTEEGRMLMAYGLEGKTYEYDANGDIVYTKAALENTDGISAALRQLGAWPTIPWVQQERTYILQLENDPKWGRAAAENCINPYYVEPFPILLATKEEQDQLSIALEDITTYRKEMVNSFIMGTRPISEFDAFVSELEGMGLQEVVAIKQNQWDKIMK